MNAGVRLLLVVAPMLLAAAPGEAEGIPGGFEDVALWKAGGSDDVTSSIAQGEGARGPCLCLDFDFHGGGGYATLRRPLAFDLPANWEFTFRIRGEAPPNNLEFKLVDPSGDNVWWLNRRGFEFPSAWRTLTAKKRQVEFAWGPAGGGEIRRAAAIEIAVSAGKGGRGRICLDALSFSELPPEKPYDGIPAASASSSLPSRGPDRALDADPATFWESEPDVTGPQWLLLDFGERREYGGLVIDWDGDAFARRFEAQVSNDGESWETARAVLRGGGGRQYLDLPEAESRYLRLALQEGGSGRGYRIREIVVKPLAFSSSPNAFIEAVARDAPRGSYPRSFSGEQSYWTVVGVDGGGDPGLLGEDGALEVGRGAFSIEPFVLWDGTLVRWSDVESRQALAEGYLPIPTVSWGRKGLALEITAFASGTRGDVTLWARYRLRNATAERRRSRLFLAVRPFQVNPPTQFLGVQGGVAPIREIAWDGGAVAVNGDRAIVPLATPAGFGAMTFDEGNVVDCLARGEVPPATSLADPAGRLSGALAFDLDLGPGATGEVVIAVRAGTAATATAVPGNPEEILAATAREWISKLDRMDIDVPPQAEPLIHTLKSNLAYILIERDGPAIRPGARSYARSWIRDGALTSAALLRLGHADAAMEFADWFARYQYPNGKVPCCVDERGADPVPENDSHGEFIYLVAETWRFTRDRAFLERLWPHVEGAVAYIDALRRQRRTAEYETPEKRVFYGILPESISHEGYSDKPRHSYWDSFFALRGLKDAVELAEALGREDERARWAAIRDELETDLHASLRATIASHRIDYIPGCAELGDFDATSTTVAIFPGGECARLPQRALYRTFEKYWENFVRRRDGAAPWQNYTPYELRVVGTFVRLDWKGRAHELLDFFLRDRRPPGWNAWAEVVWKDPRLPRFVGDIPHGWVGSDYIRSLLDVFAYEREVDGALVLGAGIPLSWVTRAKGVAVRGLRTPQGTLNCSMRARGDTLRVKLRGLMEVPRGGFAIRSPVPGIARRVTVNGRPTRPTPGGEILVTEFPAEVIVRY